MSNQKHTPGPWIISENNKKEKVVLQDFRTSPLGRDIQEKVCTLKNQLDWKERDANAALIAAAPGMLNELISMYHNHITDGASDSYGAVSLSEARAQRIKSLIKDAGGEVYEP